MSWWKRILTGEGGAVKPQRLDNLNEGLALERQGDYDGAITSLRRVESMYSRESAVKRFEMLYEDLLK